MRSPGETSPFWCPPPSLRWFLSWGVTDKNREVIGNTEIKSYLIRGAKRQNGVEYPNVSSGYGMLDISGAFAQMRIN